eukprot:scaffold130770_cov32-Tisochrysis_lutea.AAC.3
MATCTLLTLLNCAQIPRLVVGQHVQKALVGRAPHEHKTHDVPERHTRRKAAPVRPSRSAGRASNSPSSRLQACGPVARVPGATLARFSPSA